MAVNMDGCPDHRSTQAVVSGLVFSVVNHAKPTLRRSHPQSTSQVSTNHQTRLSSSSPVSRSAQTPPHPLPDAPRDSAGPGTLSETDTSRSDRSAAGADHRYRSQNAAGGA